MEVLNGIFAMDEIYRDPTPPIVHTSNLYSVSSFYSGGRALSPTGKVCDYLMVTQVLGTQNASLSVVSLLITQKLFILRMQI